MKFGARPGAISGLNAIDPPLATAALTQAARSLSSYDQPSVSILVLSRDGAELLDRMFRSFVAVNSYCKYDFVVVDHGSADGTDELLAAWSERLPIRLVRRGQNHSFSNSNNKAARFATGERLLFLNNDVIFSSDFIGPMVEALADPRIGAVGIKQYAADSELGEPRVSHLGVRFEWSVPERRLRPRHVKPGLNDALLASNPAVFPAVTGSCLMCRADDFAEVGGMEEGYFYGLEDLDLCCKIRLVLGKAIVSLNDHHLIHEKSSTRNRNFPVKESVQANNRRLFQARWGYRLRREFIQAKLDDDGSVTGAHFAVGVAAPATGGEAADGLCRALHRLFDWRVRRVAAEEGADVSGLDALVVIDGALDPTDLRNRQPHLVLISWSLQAGDGGMEAYDVCLASSAAELAALADRTSKSRRLFRPAIDPVEFAPGVGRPDLACDCVVLGSLGEELQQVLTSWANNWPLTVRKAPCGGTDAADGARRAAMFRSAPLTIHSGSGAGAASVQALEALACGSLVLTNDRTLAEEVFSGFLPLWQDAAGLEAAVRRYRDDLGARQALAQWLRETILREHTFDRRAHVLRDIISEELERIRIGVKLGPVCEGQGEAVRAFALALARSLDRLGFRVRIDTDEQWYTAASLADDVTIIAPGGESYTPSADQINFRVAFEPIELATAKMRDAILVEHGLRRAPPAIVRPWPERPSEAELRDGAA